MTKRKRKLIDPVVIGRKGGRNSRKNLSVEERTALARKAAEARWGKKGAGIV